MPRNANISQRMTQELGKAIVGGVYSSGETLPTEAALCEQFGVSRTAVREAVKMLSAKGLVASRPRQGIRILPEQEWNIFDADLLRWSLESRPSLEVLREFLQLRIAIEPEAASLAAREADPERLARIGEALEAMRRSRDRPEAALQADIDFHVSILFATGNRFYIRLRDFIQTALNVSIRYTNRLKGDPGAVVEEHASVYRAICRGEEDNSRRLMRALVAEAQGYIRAELQRKMSQ